jgi:hypothetical protein
MTGFDENIVDWGLEDVELAYRLDKLGIHIEINPYLEAIHQNPGHRDDVAIGQARLEGYLGNIRYFLNRHPEALAHHADPVEVLVEGHRYRELVPGKTDLCVDNFEDNCPAELALDLIRMAKSRHDRVILFDYASVSNLDVHVQKLHSQACPILYFPMTRKVDVAAMTHYISAMRASTAALA